MFTGQAKAFWHQHPRLRAWTARHPGLAVDCAVVGLLLLGGVFVTQVAGYLPTPLMTVFLMPLGSLCMMWVLALVLTAEPAGDEDEGRPSDEEE